MPAIHKGSPKIKFKFVASKRQSVLSGLPAIEAVAQEFDLWRKLRELSLIDLRNRKGSDFGPDAIVAQFIYCFASGGASLADAERMEEDSLARMLARMEAFADETTLGEWLWAQTPEGVRAFWKLIQEFIAWAAKRAEAARWKHCGRSKVFFDDSQLEVSGKTFEGAKVNYNGDLALVTVKLLCLPEECQSWQVKTILRQIIRLSATLVHHVRRLLVRVEVPASWLVWWENVHSTKERIP